MGFRTPLYHLHRKLGAKILEFAGWEMPLLYRGIVAEHLHTRSVSSIFDVSHMGRIFLSGPGATELLERICTRKLSDMPVGKVRYSHICNEAGGVIDDVVVSRYEDKWLLACNAGNRRKVLSWLEQHALGRSVSIEDRTEETAMLAIQGPATLEIVRAMLPVADLASLNRWSFLAGSYAGADFYVSRTGYTGEDGFEVVVPAAFAELTWSSLCQSRTDSASDRQILPAGLGARDTLRIEAGLPLYGHELTEQIDPISAGFEWVVCWDKPFIGREALSEVKRRGPTHRLVGLQLEGRRIARAESEVLDEGGRKIGWVTSGTLSPTLNRSIAMAYLRAEHAATGRAIAVQISTQTVTGKIVPLPFYRGTK